MGKVIAVCSSQKKGTRKCDVREGVLEQDYGLVGDAHADCCSHRQVSLLAAESIGRIWRLGIEVGPGDFAENLTTEGINLASLPVGTRLSVGNEVILEVTQIGKECHKGCAIFRQIGRCVMPEEGVFARVVRRGPVRSGDQIGIAVDGKRD